MQWAAIIGGLIAFLCVFIAIPHNNRRGDYTDMALRSSKDLYARHNSRVSQGLAWRAAGTGLGVAVFKDADNALKDIANSCNNFTGEKQIVAGVACVGHAMLFMFKAAAYGWAIHSGIVTVATAFDFCKRKNLAHLDATQEKDAAT